MTEQTEGSGPSELELLKQRARLIGVEFSNNIGIDTLRERVNAKMNEITEGDVQPVTATGTKQDETLPDQIQTDLSEDFDADIPEEELQEETQVNGLTAAAQIAAAKVTAPPTTPIMPSGEIKPIAPIVDRGVSLSSSGKVGSATKTREGKTPTLRQHLYNEQMKLVRVRIQNLDPKKADLNGEVICIANKHLGNVKMFVPYGETTDDGWHIPYIIYKELARRRFLSIRTIKDPKTKQPVVKKGWAKEFAIDILPPLSEAELRSLAVAQAAAGSIESTDSNLL